MSARFEILEHTSDVGLTLQADTLEEIFQAAGEGLATLQGSWFPGVGEEREMEVKAVDNPGLLVAWINELLYVQDSENAVFGGFAVNSVSDGSLKSVVKVAPRAEHELDTVGVKAATHDRLRLERGSRGWTADLYLDV
ncbi:MAG: archease [Actinomycetota bacterium]